MYDIFSKKWIPCEILYGFYYRADSRPPSTIMREGFLGTKSTNHCFASFDSETVFCSSSLEGVISFKKSALQESIVLPYIYRINANGLRGYKFNENTNSYALAEVLFERNESKYKKLRRYNKGHFEFISYLSNKLRLNIDAAFIPVKEVHVQGPIPASRINCIMNEWG